MTKNADSHLEFTENEFRCRLEGLMDGRIERNSYMLNAKFSECKYYKYRDAYSAPIFAGAFSK